MDTGAIFLILGTLVMFFGVFLYNELFSRWEPLLSVRRIGFILFGLTLFLYGKSTNETYRETDLFNTRFSEGMAEALCQEAFRDEVRMLGLNQMRYRYYPAEVIGDWVSLTALGRAGYPDYDVECEIGETLKNVVSIQLFLR